MVDISIGRSIPLRHDTFDLLVTLELLCQALLVNLDRLKVLATGRRVVDDFLPQRPGSLDVIIDSFETFETFQVVVCLPRVVDVRVILPFD